MIGWTGHRHTHTYTHRQRCEEEAECPECVQGVSFAWSAEKQTKKNEKKRRQQAIFGTQSEVVRAKLEQTCLKAANWAEFIPTHTHLYTRIIKRKNKKNLLKAELTNKQNANKKKTKSDKKLGKINRKRE